MNAVQALSDCAQMVRRSMQSQGWDSPTNAGTFGHGLCPIPYKARSQGALVLFNNSSRTLRAYSPRARPAPGERPFMSLRHYPTIHSAREGIHVTLSGEYQVTHSGQRTYVTPAPETEGYPLTVAGREPRGGWDYSVSSTVAERQVAADKLLNPRRDEQQ